MWLATVDPITELNVNGASNNETHLCCLLVFPLTSLLNKTKNPDPFFFIDSVL